MRSEIQKTGGLTRAERYRGWKKEPSRFLTEMGLQKNDTLLS